MTSVLIGQFVTSKVVINVQERTERLTDDFLFIVFFQNLAKQQQKYISMTSILTVSQFRHRVSLVKVPWKSSSTQVGSGLQCVLFSPVFALPPCFSAEKQTPSIIGRI